MFYANETENFQHFATMFPYGNIGNIGCTNMSNFKNKFFKIKIGKLSIERTINKQIHILDMQRLDTSIFSNKVKIENLLLNTDIRICI